MQKAGRPRRRTAARAFAFGGSLSLAFTGVPLASAQVATTAIAPDTAVSTDAVSAGVADAGVADASVVNADPTTDTAAPATTAAANDPSAISSALNDLTGALEAAAAISPMAATSFAATTPTAPTGFATGGSGRFKNEIEWIQWADSVTNTNLLDSVGQSMVKTQTRDLGEAGSLQTRCTVTMTQNDGAQPGNGLKAYRPGTFGGDGLDDLYNVGGTDANNQLIIGLSNSKDRLVTTGDNPSVTGFDYSCEARLVAKD